MDFLVWTGFRLPIKHGGMSLSTWFVDHYLHNTLFEFDSLLHKFTYFISFLNIRYVLIVLEHNSLSFSPSLIFLLLLFLHFEQYNLLLLLNNLFILYLLLFDLFLNRQQLFLEFFNFSFINFAIDFHLSFNHLILELLLFISFNLFYGWFFSFKIALQFHLVLYKLFYSIFFTSFHLIDLLFIHIFNILFFHLQFPLLIW